MTLYPRIQIFSLFEQGYIHHRHLAGVLRGLICYICNNLLGMANDDPKILIAEAKYIVENKVLFVEQLASWGPRDPFAPIYSHSTSK